MNLITLISLIVKSSFMSTWLFDLSDVLKNLAYSLPNEKKDLL